MIKDLDEAVSKSREVVDLIPPDHPDLITHLNNLGCILFNQYGRTGKAKDLDEAIF
jgi:hypothetical protein